MQIWTMYVYMYVFHIHITNIVITTKTKVERQLKSCNRNQKSAWSLTHKTFKSRGIFPQFHNFGLKQMCLCVSSKLNYLPRGTTRLCADGILCKPFILYWNGRRRIRILLFFILQVFEKNNAVEYFCRLANYCFVIENAAIISRKVECKRRITKCIDHIIFLLTNFGLEIYWIVSSK